MSFEILLELDNYLMYLNFVSLAIVFYFGLKSNKLSSSLLALGIMMTFSFLMTSYTQPLYQAAVKYQDDYLHLFRFLWFVGFAFWDAVIVSLVFYTHYHFKLRRSFCANAILLAYVVKFHLHWALYTEKEFFTSKHLEPLYQYGIPTVNSLLAAAVFGYVITVWGSLTISKYSKFKRLSWHI